MRVAHFDCFSGISGDMVLGAVIDAGVPAEAIRAALDSLGLPITLEVEKVKRNGIAGTKATVTAPDQEEYRFLRRQLVSHTTCECSGARDYIQRASKVLEGLGGDAASPLAGTPALEKTLRASLSQLAADASPLDPALVEDDSDGPELDGMTL